MKYFITMPSSTVGAEIVAEFDNKYSAIAFAQEHYGADDQGRFLMIANDGNTKKVNSCSKVKNEYEVLTSYLTNHDVLVEFRSEGSKCGPIHDCYYSKNDKKWKHKVRLTATLEASTLKALIELLQEDLIIEDSRRIK